MSRGSFVRRTAALGSAFCRFRRVGPTITAHIEAQP